MLLLWLLAAQTQALRTPPARPLRITHVHRAVTAPTTDAATNRVALTFPVLTVAAAALGRAAPQSVAATLGTKAAFRRGLALHALLGTAGDETEVTLLYSSKTEEDILARAALDAWAADEDEHRLRGRRRAGRLKRRRSSRRQRLAPMEALASPRQLGLGVRSRRSTPSQNALSDGSAPCAAWRLSPRQLGRRRCSRRGAPAQNGPCLP